MKTIHPLLFLIGGSVTNLLAQSPGYLLWQHVETASSSRSTVAPIGDINGDGFADVLAGGTQVQVLSGVDGRSLSVVPVPSLPIVHLALAGLDDINSDNVPDFVVGNGNFTSGPFPNAGAVWVFSGRDNSILYTIHGTAANQTLGKGLANAGDTDGDGTDDILIGGPYETTTTAIGMAMVVSGRTGQVLRTFAGLNIRDHFGRRVTGIGDADFDGFADVAISARLDASGRIYAFSGRTGAPLWNVYGPTNPGSITGESVAGAGDMNNDGRGDVVVGIVVNSIPSGGAVRVLSGFDGSVIHHVSGAVSELFGWSVDGGADFNGDNVPDFVAGTRSSSYVKVFSGSNANLLAHIVGQPDMGFGRTVRIAKIDADPYPDIVATNADYGAGYFLAYSLVPPATAMLVGVPRIGNTVMMQLASPGDAGLSYAAGFSLDSRPGITLRDTRNIPLNLDPLLIASLGPNPYFINNVAMLSANGTANVQFRIPNAPDLIGWGLFSAFVVVDPAAPSAIRRVSNSLSITIQ